MAKRFLLQSLTNTFQKAKEVTPPPQALNPFEKALKLEEKLLLLPRLEHHKLSVCNVPINFQGKQFLHTIQCIGHHENKENLVLIHGYSGSSALFYPVLKGLSERFNVYCVDLLGLGLSSRPDFPCTSTQETIDYFIDSLEEWRRTLNLGRIFIGGHSLGGYLSTFYALKYQDILNGLYLLSPTGIIGETQQERLRKWGPKMTAGQIIFWSLYFEGYSSLIWKDKLTPMEFVRKNPKLGKMVIKSYISILCRSRRHQAATVSDFVYEMLSIEGGSEQAIHYLLRPPYMDAHIPLDNSLLKNLSIPVHCFYGEQDWVDWTGAYEIIPNLSNFKFHLIPNAGHQLVMQNPIGLSRAILHH